MKSLNTPLIVMLIPYLLAACATGQAGSHTGEEGMEAINGDSLAANIRILSGDDFMGRKPFTEGEKRTLEFLQTKFREVGLEPGNNGSFLQEVPMVNIETRADSVMRITSPSGSFTLKGYDEYVIWTERTDPRITLSNAEVVFAGYGVVAPEFGWNDYEGVDVNGKVVLVMVNDPGFGVDTSLFKGDTMTYYGRWTYKFEEAARQGAIGCIIIHETHAASYPFTVVQNNWNSSRLRLNDNREYCSVVGWVSETAAKKLLEAAGKDTALTASANRRGFRAQPLGIGISAGMDIRTSYNTTYNVIGQITGSQRPQEAIIYTAHWDHLGIGKPDETGDSIYNGALDNASGTAGLIELARAFKSAGQSPARTVVFLAVTAEEQGLWGSAYYAQNPVFPVATTVANINMDGLNLLGRARDMIIVGKGQSDLEDSLLTAAEEMGREISFETHPEAGYYYRSDHFNFAKVGIPALYTARGVQIEGKDKDFGKKADEDYRANHYHRPSDEFREDWSMDGAVEDLKMLFIIGKRLANSGGWPQWKQGSEFRAIRDSSRRSVTGASVLP